MAKATNQGRGGVEEIKGMIISRLYFVLSFLILYSISSVSIKNIFFSGKTSQAQNHPRRRGKKIGAEEEGGGGASPT